MWTHKSRGCLYYYTTARSLSRNPPFCYFVVTFHGRKTIRFSEVRKRSRLERFITTPSCSRREYRGSQARDPAINPTEKWKVLSSLSQKRSRQLSSSYKPSLYFPPLLALRSHHVLAWKPSGSSIDELQAVDLARHALLRYAFRDQWSSDIVVSLIICRSRWCNSHQRERID